ncbi:MAG: hypothetical protein LQ347_004565 [Umbilicaria vellea]|nr:MAG: hypothetical protein LQ347_004565 [Umbilicaria vellea]
MAHEAPTYPSPTGHQMGDGTHPFYSNQQPIPSAEEMSLQRRLSREVPPNMTDNIGDGQEIQRAEQVMHNLAQAQMHSPQQLAQGGLDPNQDSSYGDGSAKKRTKVSRACDECRRKKIRCDATSESGIEQCSSCKRVGGTCKFSRVPMKRGPSKGYIKELADRLVNLENSIQPNQNAALQYGDMNHDGISPRVMNGYSPQEDVPGSISRKRTHSMSEGLNNPPYAQPQLQQHHERAPSASAWSTQDPQRHLPHPVAGYANPQLPHQGYSDMSYITPGRRAQASPNGMPSAPWRRDSISAYAESGEHDLPHEATFEWDEQAIDDYTFAFRE